MNAPRIVSLLAAGTEYVHALGLADNLVGISHECDFPDAVLHLPRVTSTAIDDRAASADIDRQVRELAGQGTALYRVDEDQLERLEPDVIITQSHCDVCAVSLDDVRNAVDRIPALNDTTIVTLNPTTLDDILDDLVRIGQAVNAEDAARDARRACDRRIAAVTERAAVVSPGDRPTVACIEWLDPLIPAANWIPQMLERAAARPAIPAVDHRSRPVPWPELHEADPDVIIAMPCGFDLERTVTECLATRDIAGWDRFRAVRNQRAYATDGNAYFNRSGPRMVDSLELLAALIHPERFPEFAALRENTTRILLP